MREAINRWHVRNYGVEADFSDVFAVSLAFGEWAGHDIDVYADIVNCVIYRELCGATIDELDVEPEDIEKLEPKDLVEGDWRYVLD